MKFKVAVFIYDDINGSNIRIREGGVWFAANPVPVWLEAVDDRKKNISSVIGKAKLSIHVSTLWAEMDVIDGIFRDLPIENLYPHIGGAIVKVLDNSIDEMFIDNLNLLFNKPLDTRIGSLYEQGVRNGAWFLV